MEYIPVMLNVSERHVIIIGGGQAAFKKARNLAPHCASITVIASRFSKSFDGMPVVKVKMNISSASQLQAFFVRESVVVIATDDTKLNDSLESACRERGILYNRVDRKSSPFIFPASFDIRGIVVAVSTRGRSPSFSRFLSEKLQEDVGRYAAALPVLERLRSDVAVKELNAKADFFHRLLGDPRFWKLVTEGKEEKAYEFGLRMSSRALGVDKTKTRPQENGAGKRF